MENSIEILYAEYVADDTNDAPEHINDFAMEYDIDFAPGYVIPVDATIMFYEFCHPVPMANAGCMTHWNGGCIAVNGGTFIFAGTYDAENDTRVPHVIECADIETAIRTVAAHDAHIMEWPDNATYDVRRVTHDALTAVYSYY